MKGNTFENDLLKLIFHNIDIANFGDATGIRGSSSPGSLHFALHTADPGEGGDQTTNECNYTGYGRKAVTRGTGEWTISNNNVKNTNEVAFNACTGGSNSATHWSIGTASSGSGRILYKGSLGTALLGPCTGLASNDTITIPGLTGVAVNDRIVFFPAAESTLPAGITEGTHYFVKTVSGNDITISTTAGGATLNITADGDAIAYKATVLAISENITPRFAALAWSLFED